jgi:CTP synthase
LLGDVHGILVPGGFGTRGFEGKIQAVTFARERKVPFFGICLGMQMAVVEYARNICGLAGAHTMEFAPDTPFPVVDLMEQQRSIRDKGGTMRLGAYHCSLKPDTLAHNAYNTDEISERHRHRYEVNNEYREIFEKNGMVLSGLSPDGKLVEIIELQNHPWFVGCQFHPEFKSTPINPSPLFRDFVRVALEYKSSLSF